MMLTAKKIHTQLVAAVKAAGGPTAWARDNNVSAQYVCDCLRGRKVVGNAIAKALGYRRVIAFEALEDQQQ